jgi:hypothetical protein
MDVNAFFFQIIREKCFLAPLDRFFSAILADFFSLFYSIFGLLKDNGDRFLLAVTKFSFDSAVAL